MTIAQLLLQSRLETLLSHTHNSLIASLISNEQSKKGIPHPKQFQPQSTHLEIRDLKIGPKTTTTTPTIITTDHLPPISHREHNTHSGIITTPMETGQTVATNSVSTAIFQVISPKNVGS